MAISEFEIKRCEREIEKFLAVKRPPAHIRTQLDFGYRISDQSVELFEIRPEWRNPKTKMEVSFAKATYIKKENHWKIFWQRQNLKWQSYEPVPTVKHIEEFLSVVAEDKNACFFG